MTNDATVAALDHYLDEDHAVPHALLVQGAWGVGKTTFLKRVYFPARAERPVDPLQKAYHSPIFVSLFGLSTPQDLQRRLFEEISPVGSVFAGLVGVGADVAAKWLKADAVSEQAKEKFAELFQEGIAGRVFVFDDLERADVDLGPLLGFINQIVETYGGRVILVANEEELAAHPGINWASRAEKLVGRRVEVEPDPVAILNAIVVGHPNQAFVAFVDRTKGSILDAFWSSKTDNMRALVWALVNIERIVSALPEAELREQHARDIAGLVTAATMDVRKGRLTLSDLFEADETPTRVAMIGAREGKELDLTTVAGRLCAFQQRYASQNPDRPAIGYSFIGQAERSGAVDAASLKHWLRVNFSVGVEGDIPAWRRLWGLKEHSQAELDTLIGEVADDLARHRIREIGLILHCAGLAVRLSEFGDTRITGGQPIPNFFEAYAKTLADAGSIEPVEHATTGDLDSGFGGLGYTASDRPEFVITARKVLVQAQARHTAIAAQLAERIVAAAEAGDFGPMGSFDDDVAFRPLHRAPGFASIDPSRVATLIADGGPKMQRVLYFLQERFERATQRGQSPDPEIDWARDVVAKAFELIARKPPLEAAIREYYVRSWFESFDERMGTGPKLLQTGSSAGASA